MCIQCKASGVKDIFVNEAKVHKESLMKETLKCPALYKFLLWFLCSVIRKKELEHTLKDVGSSDNKLH